MLPKLGKGPAMDLLMLSISWSARVEVVVPAITESRYLCVSPLRGSFFCHVWPLRMYTASDIAVGEDSDEVFLFLLPEDESEEESWLELSGEEEEAADRGWSILWDGGAGETPLEILKSAEDSPNWPRGAAGESPKPSIFRYWEASKNESVVSAAVSNMAMSAPVVSHSGDVCMSMPAVASKPSSIEAIMAGRCCSRTGVLVGAGAKAFLVLVSWPSRRWMTVGRRRLRLQFFLSR